MNVIFIEFYGGFIEPDIRGKREVMQICIVTHTTVIDL